MLVNFSNHPSEHWGKEQLNASKIYGEIVDVPFPLVSASANEAEIDRLSKEYLEKILSMNPECVMCQGEFTLSFRIVNGLMEKGIKVVAACSERKVLEINSGDGIVERKSVYKFARYRFYE